MKVVTYIAISLLIINMLLLGVALYNNPNATLNNVGSRQVTTSGSDALVQNLQEENDEVAPTVVPIVQPRPRGSSFVSGGGSGGSSSDNDPAQQAPVPQVAPEPAAPVCDTSNFYCGADINHDNDINLSDYLIIDSFFASQELCTAENSNCQGANFNTNTNYINADDYFFIDYQFAILHPGPAAINPIVAAVMRRFQNIPEIQIEGPCSLEANDFCAGADFNQDTHINNIDYGIIDSYFASQALCTIENNNCDHSNVEASNDIIDANDYFIIDSQFALNYPQQQNEFFNVRQAQNAARQCSLTNDFCDQTDLNKDGSLNKEDYDLIDTQIALAQECSMINNFCSGADFLINGARSGLVDADDYFYIDSKFAFYNSQVQVNQGNQAVQCSESNNLCNSIDLDNDGFASLGDYDVIDSYFASQALCTSFNNFCDGSNFAGSDYIDADDYFVMDSRFAALNLA